MTQAWSASPGQRLVAGAARVKVGARRLGQLALLCLLCSLLAACKVQLYSGLTQRDANEMLAVLLQAGIEADTVAGKEDVSLNVEQSQIERAILLLNQRGLPQRKFQTLGDVFKQESLISSPLEQRARLIYAMSEELSRTLLQFDGVIVARVHIALPDRKPNEGTPTPPSAAVYIKYQDGYDISAYVPQIKQLVANSIEGLTYDKVTVVPVRAVPGADLNVVRPKPRETLDQRTLLMLMGGAAGLIAVGAAGGYLVIQRRRGKAAAKAG